MPRNIMNSDWAHTSNITDVTNVGLLVVVTNVQHTYIYIYAQMHSLFNEICKCICMILLQMMNQVTLK